MNSNNSNLITILKSSKPFRDVIATPLKRYLELFIQLK